MHPNLKIKVEENRDCDTNDDGRPFRQPTTAAATMGT